MNYSDIQHRFANKQEGKNGCVRSGNVRYEGRNFYSYSTVFGQWLDTDKNVCVYFDGSTTPSSTKHRLGRWLFPDDVHAFPYRDGRDSYDSYEGCLLVSWGEFKFEHRMTLLEHYVERIFNQLAAINDGKRKGLENVSFEAWGYIEELCSLYKDTTINKYLKWTKNKDYKKLVKMLKTGERNVETLTDALFGEGTFKKYWDYCARYRKSENKRAKVEELCERLGIASHYESWSRGRMDTGLTADQIRKLTAKERLDLHFKALAYKEYKGHEDEREKKYNKNMRNAYKWIVGHEPKKKSWGCDYESYVDNNCVNKDNGVVYECSGNHIFGFYWCHTCVSFYYDEFRNSEDKEQWIEDFYAECNEVANNRKAISILKRIKAHTKEKAHSYDDDVYLNDDYLRENTTDEEYAICAEFIRKQDKHYKDEEAKRRAAEIERIRREEEARKEREYMEQVKQEEIDECLMRGVEGCRDLWRKRLQSINTARLNAPSTDSEFFERGNVLLRLSFNKDKVETSQHIRMPIEVAKKFFHIIKKWHENPSCFKETVIDTKGSGKYTISSYQNDILTAGCHKIAYKEMDRMYNEIQGL